MVYRTAAFYSPLQITYANVKKVGGFYLFIRHYGSVKREVKGSMLQLVRSSSISDIRKKTVHKILQHKLHYHVMGNATVLQNVRSSGSVKSKKKKKKKEAKGRAFRTDLQELFTCCNNNWTC